ncbi:MAG: DGQHR domain-containing protein [Chloroflexi bacterium]|nr:DGQHR domain-containing protein [Chloroflexota bacterium]
MEFVALKGTNLNTVVYRGFGAIKDIAAISAADTYNQDSNPEGLQRDLSEKHSREAYTYAEGSRVVPDYRRLWPEVVLNVRDESLIDIKAIDERHGLYRIVVEEKKIDKSLPRPQISRVDGNHRLYFGNGNDSEQWPPLDVPTPFCVTLGLDPKQEASLFIDINDNLKAMNTSHLAHLRTRLTESEKLAAEDPELWIANKLVDDARSPFHGIVYRGGEKTQTLDRRVNLAALKTGIDMLLKECVKLRGLEQIEAKYAMIRLYWNAVSRVFAREWANQKDYLLLRGFGVWSMSIVGAEIIDRCIARRVPAEKLETEIVEYLRQTRKVVEWDYKDGNARGYGGRIGARQLAENMKRVLSDEEVDMGSLARSLTKAL